MPVNVPVRSAQLAISAAAAAFVPLSASAGVTVFEDETTAIEFGAHIQFAAAWLDDDVEGSQSENFFRRLRPYIQGTLNDEWAGRIEVDFGKSLDDDEVQVKDAYISYLGLTNHTVEIGNTKTPFSREWMTSGKRQQTTERGFVGDHNFGTPDRQMGLRLLGQNTDKSLTYALAVGGEDHDPDVRRIDFDSPANTSSDWNQGYVIAGRLDWHPWGFMAFDQGDFERGDFKGNFSVAAFAWSNGEDNNTYTGPGDTALSLTRADLDSADGVELSAGLRGRGISADIEYNLIRADTVANGFTGGVYRNGSTELDKFHLEGGYMLPGNSWEIVSAYETLDADNYDNTWEAYEIGVNYFFKKHDVKLQLNYRHGENVFGESGHDADSIVAMMQLVF